MNQLLLTVKIKLTAVKVLKNRLDIKGIIHILPKLSARQKKGEPWDKMPPATEIKDIESRKLIGDAILLYRELLLITSPYKAQDTVREVITESAITQLNCLIPSLTKERIKSMNTSQRKETLCEIINRFPNSDWEITKAGENDFSFCIERCRLVELITAAGHPELKDAFCTGDALYFDRHQPEIDFSREHTIGAGDDFCDFNFRLKQP